MANSNITTNNHGNEKIPAWKAPSFWHITVLMAIFSLFYYMDAIINHMGWLNLRWGIFYTVHDLHRALFLIPAMYAVYKFRLKGIIVTSLISFLILLPRALFVSPYPDPLLRALIFMISMVIMGVLLSLLLNSRDESRNLKQNLVQAQDDLQRKRAEEMLKESEERYRRITDNMSDFISEIDAQGIFRYNSPSIRRILGYNPEELIGSSAFDLVHPEDRDLVIATYMDGVKTESDRYVEQRYQRKDGNYIWLRSSGSPLYGRDGKYLGMIVNSNNITERKQAETALRESEEKFKTLFNAADDAIFTMNHSVFLDCNITTEKIFGCSKEQIVSHSPIEFSPERQPDGRLSSQAAVERIEAAFAGQPQFFEWLHTHLDGTPFYAEVSLNRIFVGRDFILQAIVRDISERKRVEKLMYMQSEILKLLISDITAEQTVGKIVDIIKQATEHDAVGVRIRTGNDYPFVASLGYSEEFLKAENTLTYNYPDGGLCRNDDGTISLECTCGMIISGKSDPDNQILTPGGSFWTNNSLPFLDVPPDADPRLHPRNRCIHVGFLSLALIPIRAGKEVIGLLHLADRRKNSFSPAAIPFYEGIGISIGVALSRKRAKEEIIRLNTELESMVNERTSELHNSQLALLNLVDDLNQSVKDTDVANKKLEEANKELAAFSYSVSHDLRAPLRSIDGFSLALMEDYQEKLDDTGRNYLHRIRVGTQHMGVLIEDMLKLSRIIHTELRLQPIDLSSMIREIIKNYQEKDSVRIVDKIIKEGINIMGDFDMMHIVLTNLIDNAIKFTGKTAQPRIEFGMTNHEGKRVIFVRDNGAGFDMAYADKLFGAFQRLHSADEFPGTGIGLATVKRIIARHGGQIWAEGEPGKGATFFFTIPE